MAGSRLESETRSLKPGDAQSDPTRRKNEAPMTTPVRNYLAADFAPTELPAIEAVLAELNSRELPDADALEGWCRDYSEVCACMAEEAARRFVDHTCHTEDEAITARYMEWVEEIAPVLKERCFQLDQRLSESPHLDQLDAGEFSMWIRSVRNSNELFRTENIPLETEDTKLESNYDKMIGAMTVEFDGETRTLPFMGRVLEETDRDRREQAFRAIWDRVLEDGDRIDEIFDRQLELRQQMAVNAGFDEYRALRFRKLERFDYTPEDCLEFHASIEAVAVPLVRKRLERRREQLGLEKLRPWDTAVDPHGRAPLRPFEGGDALIHGCRRMFQQVDPALGEHFQILMDHDLLDLESRPGKAPGGYQYSFQETRRPFIFMNAAGLQRDVETLLHEGGHAFHSIESNHHSLLFNRGYPIEFAEVASMSMELLAAPHLGEFYGSEEEVRRARIDHLEGILSIFPWVAMIDGFQHWLYTHPGHSRDERRAAWLGLMDRFSTDIVDWTGLEEVRASRWKRQSHLFGVPFYYVEYAIAQIGSLQVWKNYQEDPAAAVSQYRHGLSLGNTRPLPELFSGAGIRFDFSEGNLRELLTLVDAEIESLENPTSVA
jgi:oligoendopeptidase F